MKKVLIVVDMQKDFIDGALGTEEAQMIVENAVHKIESFDGLVIATMDTHSTDYENTQEGRLLPVPHCIEGTDGWKLDERIQKALGERCYMTVTKPTFGSLELPERLKALVKTEEELTIEIIGLCTDICVVSNALSLKMNFPETEITVDSACCAGVTPEKHQAALETMRSCQINVI